MSGSKGFLAGLFLGVALLVGFISNISPMCHALAGSNTTLSREPVWWTSLRHPVIQGAVEEIQIQVLAVAAAKAPIGSQAANRPHVVGSPHMLARRRQIGRRSLSRQDGGRRQRVLPRPRVRRSK